MQLIFLIPLTVSFLAGYIFNKSADEMAYLFGSVTIISLILALAVAPWQIQLLILGCVIVGTRSLLRQNEYKIIQTENRKSVTTIGNGNKPK